MNKIHVFTMSGLGNAPFYLHHPVGNEVAEVSGVFFCEHCGTVLKNRHFIKSSDGKVSVVGIDCLNKTGDAGLIDAVKAENRKAKEEQRHAKIDKKVAEHRSKEIEKYGKTVEEIVREVESNISTIKEEIKELIEESFVVEELLKSNFGIAMTENIKRADALSESMINIIKEIIAKKMSQSKKGSKKYKEIYPQAEKIVDDFMDSINEKINKIKTLKEKRMTILNTKL